jgi:uncharacterized coiled-coil DUF342 family protein
VEEDEEIQALQMRIDQIRKTREERQGRIKEIAAQWDSKVI